MSSFNNNTKFLVYPNLPRAGLGNMLLIWARAVLFAHLNNFEIISPNWGNFSIGSYLRFERETRYYGYLFSNKNYVSKFKYWYIFLNKNFIIHNPKVSKFELVFPVEHLNISNNFYLFIFNQLPHWSDLFADLKEDKEIIKEKLSQTIRPSVLKTILHRPAPQIGIHIRMGDFRQLKPEDDFTKLGNVRTPMSWFIDIINVVRQLAGYTVPVTIFSDGHDYELVDLLKLTNISRASRNSALSDMFTLSRSKILIASSGSTFSSWASYLGNCPTIWHPAHFHAGVFSSDVSRCVFEGGFDPESMAVPNLLLNNIKSAFKSA